MHIYPLSCISCQENLLILGGCHMRAGVLTCESVTEYVQAAQRRLGTDYPVFVLHYRGTDDPGRMKRQIVQAMEELPRNIDTVLVAMGFCGGSWNQVKAVRRLVIPRVDDCVSLLINGTVQHSASRTAMGSGCASNAPGGRRTPAIPGGLPITVSWISWIPAFSIATARLMWGLPRNARTRCTAALVMSLAATACWNGWSAGSGRTAFL